MWRGRLNLEGFNPFDTLAVGWVTHGDLMESMPVGAWIERRPADGAEGTVRTKPYLLVDAERAAARRMIYVYRPGPGFKSVLLVRLAGAGRR